VAGQPGLGGRDWLAAVEESTAKDKDPDGEIARRINLWLDNPRFERRKGLPKASVMERCGHVARWARGYAGKLQELGKEPALSEALLILAGHAGDLADLAEAMPGAITEPQLGRLLVSVQEDGIRLRVREPQVAGPRLIRSLAELSTPCERLIWMDTHTGEVPSSPWTAAEEEALKVCDIDVGKEGQLLSHLRAAERAGLMKVKSHFLAIDLASFSETRAHPVWLQCVAAFDKRKPLILESLISQGARDHVWPLPVAKLEVQPGQPVRETWKVDAKLLKDRKETSAGDLADRLGCPLKWVFNYAAGLRASPIARLSDEFLLKGNFSHSVLESVFGGKAGPGSAAEAGKRAGEVFDSLVASEAAVFAQPGAARARLELRQQIMAAARELFTVLERGRYKIKGFEVEPGGKLLGRSFIGRIDCLIEGPERKKAIIDLKYSGRKKYRLILEEGKAVQLAVYAAAAAGDGRGKVEEGTAAGYLIIDSALLLTPVDSPVAGARGGELVAGSSIIETWDKFAAAYKVGEGWLDNGEIPVRPLQESGQWPPGADVALRFSEKNRYQAEGFDVCRYCDYPALCGVKETL
jgi:hypothetical protein